MFHLSIKGYCKTRPRRSYSFLSMFKLHCKRHYRKLATYSWCTTWHEHVTKTAPARRRHSVGGAPISYDRRRRRQQNVGGGGAAAHSSSLNNFAVPFSSKHKLNKLLHSDAMGPSTKTLKLRPTLSSVIALSCIIWFYYTQISILKSSFWQKFM